MTARAWAIGAALLVVGATAGGCNVTRTLRDCDAATDCPRGSTCDQEGHFCTDAAPILVGVSLPLSGSYAAGLGRDSQAAIAFATTLVNNQAGGVRRRGIEFRIVDDASDPAVAKDAIAALVAAGAVAIIGPMTSTQTVAAQEATYSKQVLHVTPYGGATILGSIQGDHGRFLFQSITNIQNGTGSAMPLKMAEDGCDRVVLMRSDDTQGADFARAMTENFPRATAACITKEVVFPPTEKSDYESELDDMVSALNGAKHACAALLCSAPVGGKILRNYAARATHPKVQWFGVSNLHADSFFDSVKISPTDQTTVAEGTFVTDVEVMADEVDFLGEQVARANIPGAPSPLSNPFLHTFDAAMLISLALEIAPTLEDPTALRDALIEVGKNDGSEETYTPRRIGNEGFAAVLNSIRQRHLTHINYDGATGPLEFEPNGFVRSVMHEWRVQGVTFVSDASYSVARIQELGSSSPKIDCH